MNNFPEDKMKKFASYSQNKKVLYPVFFVSTKVILFVVISAIVFLVKGEWNTLVMAFVITDSILFVLWMILLGPLLCLLNLSFIADRALKKDSNPWRSRKPYNWVLKFETNVAVYAFNMINKKEDWIYKIEIPEIIHWFSVQNDNFSSLQNA